MKLSEAQLNLLVCELANRAAEDIESNGCFLCGGGFENLANGLEDELRKFFEVYIDREYP